MAAILHVLYCATLLQLGDCYVASAGSANVAELVEEAAAEEAAIQDLERAQSAPAAAPPPAAPATATATAPTPTNANLVAGLKRFFTQDMKVQLPAALEAAYSAVDRKYFFADQPEAEVYNLEQGLRFGPGYAQRTDGAWMFMNGLLRTLPHVQNKAKTLDIGTGSGYTTSVIAALTGGEVWATETDAALVTKAEQALQACVKGGGCTTALGSKVHYSQPDDSTLLKANAPYDLIYSSTIVWQKFNEENSKPMTPISKWLRPPKWHSQDMKVPNVVLEQLAPQGVYIPFYYPDEAIVVRRGADGKLEADTIPTSISRSDSSDSSKDTGAKKVLSAEREGEDCCASNPAHTYQFCHTEPDGDTSSANWEHLAVDSPLKKRYELVAKVFSEYGCKHVLEVGAYKQRISQYMPPGANIKVTELDPCGTQKCDCANNYRVLQSNLFNYQFDGSEDCMMGMGLDMTGIYNDGQVQDESENYKKLTHVMQTLPLSAVELTESIEEGASTKLKSSVEAASSNHIDFDMDFRDWPGVLEDQKKAHSYDRHMFVVWKDAEQHKKMAPQVLQWRNTVMAGASANSNLEEQLHKEVAENKKLKEEVKGLKIQLTQQQQQQAQGSQQKWFPTPEDLQQAH